MDHVSWLRAEAHYWRGEGVIHPDGEEAEVSARLDLAADKIGRLQSALIDCRGLFRIQQKLDGDCESILATIDAALEK